MNMRFFLWLLIIILFVGIACDPVEDRRMEAYSDVQGITLADLQSEQPTSTESQSLLSFSILTYVLDTDSIGGLETIIDSLTQGVIDYQNIDAFEANGFDVGLGTHDEGASIAQKLQSIGAVRIAQGALLIPSDYNEILFAESFIGPRAVIYATSATGIGGATLKTGKIGWIISAKQNTPAGDFVQVILCPAYWQMGASDLRLLAGQDPYQYSLFDMAQIRFEMETGQFCILGPDRAVKDQDTLDRLLMTVPQRDQVRFFVIIYGGLRGTDGE